MLIEVFSKPITMGDRNMQNDYDIAIIGSGIAGAMLACVLAKHDLRVIVIDAGTHPRFAVGESMVPESASLLEILAQRFGIPELAYPGNIANIIRYIGASAAGIKLASSFAWNGPGGEQNPKEVVSTPVLAPEAHLSGRMSTLTTLHLQLASARPSSNKQGSRTSRPGPDGVSLQLDERSQIKARFLVDAAGYRSPLADQMKLRDNAHPMQSNTRSLFTHMVGVKSYEEVIAPPEVLGSPNMLWQSTLHHIFDCGWLWIIPFDNHPFSTNKLCSVGLQFDIGKHGTAGHDPDDEFKRFLDSHPSIARHFTKAARVREWTVAPRLNYTSRETVGNRYCLMGHAVGFVDPLFSLCLVNTFESINRLAPKLLRAAAQDRWQRDDLLSFERYSLEVVRINDRLVANSYQAFSTFPLWNAWFRVWLSRSYIGVLRLRKILADYMKSRDDEALDNTFEAVRFPGHLSIESHHHERMFDAACSTMEAYTAGAMTEEQAIEALRKLYVENRAHLPLDFANLSNRYVSRPTEEFAKSLTDWANKAPAGRLPNY